MVLHPVLLAETFGAHRLNSSLGIIGLFQAAGFHLSTSVAGEKNTRNTSKVFVVVKLIDTIPNLGPAHAHFYRPHPKDDGRLYFQSVHTCGGRGVPRPRSR